MEHKFNIILILGICYYFRLYFATVKKRKWCKFNSLEGVLRDMFYIVSPIFMLFVLYETIINILK